MNDEPAKRDCDNCFEWFIPKRPRQRFCSRSCSFWYLRNGEHSDLADEIAEERGYDLKD